MKLKDLKIGTQLKLGYSILILFVFILGYVSFQQTNRIHEQASISYKHPMQVRQAVSSIEADIHEIQIEYRNMFLAPNQMIFTAALKRSEIFETEVMKQFDVIAELYLGPESDVKNAKNAFIQWISLEKTTLNMIAAKETTQAINRFEITGDIGISRELVFEKIQVLDVYAQNKAKELYAESEELNNSLINRLLILVAIIVFLSFLINYVLHRNIRMPLSELTAVTRRFHDGDLFARSSFQSENEFGILSDSFNALADSIQSNTDLSKKTTSLAGIMMSEDDQEKFFRTMLHALSTHTGSQMAAIYLLSPGKKHFKCFESVGMGSLARKSFGAENLEGELGPVLTEKKVVHIKQIPDDTPFTFPVASGEFRPREIITIPIIELNEVIAVISLASLHEYTPLSVRVIHEIWVMLMSRVVGVLSFKKITDFISKLEKQNHKLEQQAHEMAMQADELKEFNIELELQKKQLDEANQLKSAFLSNMSHELRTPLNSVIALSGVLNRRLKNQIQEEEYSYLGIIEKNGKQLLALINDILDLSRIEAGKEEITYSQFVVQDLVRNIFETLLPMAKEKGITLENRIPEDLAPIISDYKKCHHILQNVIGNAVKFTEKGQVELTADLKNGNLNLGIKDTGIGISEDNLPFIFDEFRQADGKTSRKFGGTGLGLAIAKKYTKMLGGNIEVRSQEGAGTTFVLILPEKPQGSKFADNKPTSIETEKQVSFSDSLNPARGKTILVVEDSEPQIIQLSDILKEEGYSIRVARNGKEALESIKNLIPDAMILDLMMPEVDGFEVLATIRKLKEAYRLPVLILSAKHVTHEELSFLEGNNIYQLVQKGDVNRLELLGHVKKMIQAKNTIHPVSSPPGAITVSKKKHYSILLIEDNADNIVTVKALLDERFEIFTATDGPSGLEKVHRLVPDLILLDISLPGMDGFTVLKEVKMSEKLNQIPVIALTARAMKGDREDLLQHGFDDYISKPIDHNIFRDTISSWLK